jgi:hypothetical protein
LHHRVVPPPVVVIEVCVTVAQPVQPLGNQVAQEVSDALRVTGIVQHRRHGIGEAGSPIHPPQQHQAAIRTEGAPLEIRFDQPASEAPEIHFIKGTIWHRRNASSFSLDT